MEHLHLEMEGKDIRSDSNYNSNQLNKGIKIELEHTNNKAIAKKIAKDHLDEFPEYYTNLVKMEKRMHHKRMMQLHKARSDFGGVF